MEALEVWWRIEQAIGICCPCWSVLEQKGVLNYSTEMEVGVIYEHAAKFVDKFVPSRAKSVGKLNSSVLFRIWICTLTYRTSPICLKSETTT